MKFIEIKVIFDSYDIKQTQQQISNIFYEFGATGLKFDEPLLQKNPLDFYKNEQLFLMVDYAVSAYFPLNPYSSKRDELIKSTIKKAFDDRDDVVYTIDFYEYEEQDYQNNWKKYLFPEKVSNNFVVKPTWREYFPKENEFVIELDPGRAFGTGSHPTTALCLKLMEETIFKNSSVLDIGTGSGILMIAAKILGAKEVWGTDIDELAIESSRENLLLNGINDDTTKLLLGDLATVIKNKQFDIVVSNILADVILLLLDDIQNIIKKGSFIIFSGIIDDKLEEVVQKIKDCGLEILKIKYEKEWRAILIRS